MRRALTQKRKREILELITAAGGIVAVFVIGATANVLYSDYQSDQELQAAEREAAARAAYAPAVDLPLGYRNPEEREHALAVAAMYAQLNADMESGRRAPTKMGVIEEEPTGSSDDPSFADVGTGFAEPAVFEIDESGIRDIAGDGREQIVEVISVPGRRQSIVIYDFTGGSNAEPAPPGTTPTVAVPEPSSAELLMLGFAGLLVARKVCESLESRRVRR